MPNEQNFKNHGRVRTDYHVFVLLTLLAYVLWSAYRVFQGVTAEGIVGLVVAAALLVLAFSLRVQILTVQDRVIRLEMRLRLREQLPEALAAKAADLHVKQLVALRFASDEELHQLVTDVVEGRVSEPKEIKKRVTAWQADHLRA